ncbi:hypothetical protein [Prochlorothrix hollandica]|nr:hypothetical protein [Prochlorothrix hollandica]
MVFSSFAVLIEIPNLVTLPREPQAQAQTHSTPGLGRGHVLIGLVV